MITLRGKWFDGRTSEQIDAIMEVTDSGGWKMVRSDSGEVLQKQPKFTPKASPRLANTPRYLSFPDGESFETDDNESVDEILAMLRKGHWLRWVHVLETKKRYILPALAICILLGFLAVKYGFPAASKLIVAHLPDHLSEKAGEQTMNILDKMFFSPSELEPEVEARVRAHMQQAIKAHAHANIKVAFRNGGAIGPNAFALPGGQIVFTDELIDMSKNDDELLSILAHEIGHAVHQHAMRRVVQDSLLSFAILALTGDASGVSELFLGLPVILTELAYSRDFEREADKFALDYMLAHEIPPEHFANILTRITALAMEKQDKEGKKWHNYLSTHPPTSERVQAFSNNP